MKLPNVRRLFIPDKGHIICDADLSGADAQVVAWEADDEDLKSAFRAGLKLHAKNALDIFGPAMAGPDGMKEPFYSDCKAAVHATNYGASARTIAINRGWTVLIAESFQSTWFRLHPGVKKWQERIDDQISTTRMVHNKFGYRRVFFDRIEGLLPTALAWIPQSTVALVCFRGAVQLDKTLPWAEVLLQVHDSIVFQIPFHRESSLPKVQKAITVTVPYPDPLTIPWGLATSRQSWGDIKERNWE